MPLQLFFTAAWFFLVNRVTEIVFWEPCECSAPGNAARLTACRTWREFTDRPQNAAHRRYRTLIDRNPPDRDWTKTLKANASKGVCVRVRVCKTVEIGCTIRSFVAE